MGERTGERYRMVVGIDFDVTGDIALAEGLRIAREHPEDELHVAHVVKPARGGAKALEEAAAAMEEVGEQLKARVHTVCERIFPGQAWERDVAFHVRLGDPAEALNQVAFDYDCDVIIVGTHGRRGVRKLLLGSVAEELVKTACVPVLVARPRDFEGMAKSERPDAPREGEVLHDEHYYISERVVFGRSNPHIAGLI